jgi:uncharacterized caspase-like protein
MMRFDLAGCKVFFVLAICWLQALAFAQSDNAPRTALIIGNAAYTKPDASLKNAVSDARLMAQTFKDLGFEVMLREDVDRRGMQATFREFQDVVRKKKGIAVFYFAGHGVQVAGRNYIVPIGAHLVRDVDARDSALDVDVMLQGVRDTGAQLNLFILDACRNNPLLATQRGEVGKVSAGLAAMRPPAGALIAFATEPGRVAADGKEAGHGLYTKHLAKWLKEPNLTLEQVFKRTREAVKVESGDTQIPTEYSLLTGSDFYLTRTTKQTNSTVETKSKAAMGGTSRAANGADVETKKDEFDARKELTQLGFAFTQKGFDDALKNDDVLAVKTFVNAGWKVRRWDVWRWLSLNATLGQLDYVNLPVQSLSYFALNLQELGLHPAICDVKQYADEISALRVGWQPKQGMDTMFLRSRTEFDGELKLRRDFYQVICGVKLG